MQMELVQGPAASPRMRRGGEPDAEKKPCGDGGGGARALRRANPSAGDATSSSSEPGKVQPRPLWLEGLLSPPKCPGSAPLVMERGQESSPGSTPCEYVCRQK